MGPAQRHYASAFVSFLRAHARKTRAKKSPQRRELRDAEAWDRLATTIEAAIVRPEVVEER